MACQLPVDCLEEIIEFLETDKFTLYTCLLVNRFCTLIACLPDESKNLLYNNGISISPPTSKPLLFNYASFFKTLSIFGISRMIASVLKDKLSLISKDKNSLVVNEIIKMFANQIPSLKKLNYYHHYYYNNHKFNISFPQFPGMSDLSELCSFNGGSWNDIIPVITEHSHTITKLKFRSDDDSSFSFISSFSNLQNCYFHSLMEYLKILEGYNMLIFQITNFKNSYKCPKPEYVIKF
ncbi:unnamed protein product [Rhizophagus irregularis]|nr:unnamed protein product [Rhizophagus irregularis]